MVPEQILVTFLLGVGLARLFGDEAVRVLVKFVFCVAIPCLVIRGESLF